MLNFTYGFSYKGFTFGWLKKELYRLPMEGGNRSYPLKKLSLIKVGKQKGYIVRRQKFSLKQLKSKTILINKKLFELSNDKDLPF